MKNPLLPASALACALASALLSACFTGNDSTERTVMTGDAVPYHVEGNKIIQGPSVVTIQYCVGSRMEKFTDTGDGDTTEFEVSGNTLTLREYETLESGAVVREDIILTRQGRGSGIEGSWRYSDAAWSVASGTPTAEERADLDGEVAMGREIFADMDVILTFQGGKMSFAYSYVLSEVFVKQWNRNLGGFPADSALYDIDVRALDGKTVELKGRKSGEVVRVVFSGEGDRTYTSSNANNPPHTYYVQAKTCPNELEPDWFEAFKGANSKNPVMEKRARPHARP